MRNLTIITILFFLCLLTSCSENIEKEEVFENNSEIHIEEPIVDKLPDEPVVEIRRPETIDEIITFADELKVDTSMTGFSLTDILPTAQLPETEDAGDEYQNSTAYLGDSVTMGLSFFKNHPSNMVIAKGSINPLDAVEKKLIELEDGTMVNFPTALAKTDAKRAVLTFGSNAISIMNEETFLKYYIKLIDEIQLTCPDCEIIIQSITPLATTCKLKKLNNELVNRSNLLLLVLAYSKDLKFLDSTSRMKDENGYLNIDLCSSDDGIHINEKGYEIWINMLRTHKLES